MEEINNKGEDQYLDEKSDDHDDSEEECSVSEEEYMSGSNSTSENETNENSGCEADKNYNPETDPEYGGESDVSNMDVAVSSDDSNDKTVDGMYKCKTCNNSYRNKTQFDRHLKTHTGQTPYDCTFCSRTFASKGELKSHIGRFHSGERVRKYVCPIATCGKRFFEKHYLKQHVRIHSGIKPFECKVCNKGFIDIRRYNIHMRLHTGECMFSCDVCERKYLTMNALKSHMNTHTKETEYKCDICNKIFFVKGSLDKHRRIHFEDRPYKCSVCGKGFKQNSAMHTHEETHKPVELRKPKRKIEKNHECNICLKKYPTHISMLRHIRIHTGEYLKCKFCDKEFTRDDSYQVHLRNHTKQFTHECDVCGKGFACTNYLTRHMRIHTGEKRYKCEYCGDSFTQSAARNRHLKVHTGERPYKCDVCGRLYKDKHSMKTHAKSHTEDPKKNFTCDICNKGLTTKYGLSCHLKAVHGQGKPEHECQVCGKTFTMRSYLVVHLKNHVEINKSKCTLCGKTFKSDPALQNHIRLVHEVDRPYDCDRCHAGFSSQSNLKQHKESQIYILEGQELLEIKSSDWGRLDELVENPENPLKCMECGKIWTSKKRFKIHLCNMHEYNNNDKVQDQVDNEVQDQSFEEALKSAISETLQVDKTKQSTKITNEDEDTIDFSQFYLDQVEESQTEDLDLINIGNNIDPNIQHFGRISKEVTERNSREKSLLGKDSEITCKEEPLEHNVNISEKNPISTVTKKILAETVKNKTYQTPVQTAHNKDNHDSKLVKHVKLFKCSACKKEFKTQKSLKNHMFSHEKSYLFSCLICNKGFNWEDHLERHMKIHE